MNYGFYVGVFHKFVRSSLQDKYEFHIIEFVKTMDPLNCLNKAHTMADFKQYSFVVGPFSSHEAAQYFCYNPSLSINEIERRLNPKPKRK